VTSGSIQRTSRITGQTAAINFANIVAQRMQGPESGREMILIHVAKPGSWVKKGTVIAQIDAQSLQDHVDDLGDTIETAQADIRKRQAEQAIEWENLQQTLRVAKAEVDKARLNFGAAEVRTDIERQLLKLALDEADAHYKQAQNDLEFKRASHASALKLLDYTLDRHVRHRDRHARDIASFTIRAPMDGLVVMQQIFRSGEMAQVQQGDRVYPGMLFMKIVDTSSMQVEGSINQSESSEIRLAQKARIKLDAFPGLEFDGEVHSIGALASGSFRGGSYIRSVPVRLKIHGSDPKLIPDLSASADVVIETSDTGPVVPLTAVRTENGRTVAYVKKGEAFEAREIQLGARNSTHARVTAGLSPGDQVRVN
jgi:multidrug resistance efflux pump